MSKGLELFFYISVFFTGCSDLLSLLLSWKDGGLRWKKARCFSLRKSFSSLLRSFLLTNFVLLLAVFLKVNRIEKYLLLSKRSFLHFNNINNEISGIVTRQSRTRTS